MHCYSWIGQHRDRVAVCVVCARVEVCVHGVDPDTHCEDNVSEALQSRHVDTAHCDYNSKDIVLFANTHAA